jgi:hypothetical protein
MKTELGGLMELVEKIYTVKKVCANCKTSLIEYNLTREEIGKRWAILALTGCGDKRCPKGCCAGYSQYLKLQIWDGGQEIRLDAVR